MSIHDFQFSERMAAHRVPGVSIAIIRDSAVQEAFTVGLASAATGTPLTPDTLFQVSSQTKPLAAILVMKQIEEGLYTLDTPINELLTSWELPENEFTRAEPVTVRHLLSHTSGIDVPTFNGYATEGEVPDLLQVLNGEEPCTSPPVRVTSLPGSCFKYSSGGYCVLQQLLEDIAEEPFAEMLHSNILRPLGRKHSTLAQPPAAIAFPRLSSGHHQDGSEVADRFRLYPELAAASLWSTPEDMAVIAGEMQRALRGDDNVLLSRDSAWEMLTPVVEPWFGLGFSVWTKGPGCFFGHTGNTQGFRSLLIAHAERGTGAVILTNSANGDDLIKEVINTIAYVEGWPDFQW